MNSVIYNNKELFYVIERKKVKNINMRVKEDDIIYVSASKSVPEKYIKELIEKNAKKFADIIEAKHKKQLSEADLSYVKYLGKKYPLEIIKSNENKLLFENNTFKIYTPDTENHKDILFTILKWKSDECVRLYSDINKQVYNLFCQNGYNVPLASITIKLMKTRWGSCNYVKGKFSMNLRLIDYPYEAIYGVFCHEYMHFIHQNHSKAFYNDLEKICPKYKEYDKYLK